MHKIFRKLLHNVSTEQCVEDTNEIIEKTHHGKYIVGKIIA